MTPAEVEAVARVIDPRPFQEGRNEYFDAEWREAVRSIARAAIAALDAARRKEG